MIFKTGTLVRVNAGKAEWAREEWLLKYSGIGIVTKGQSESAFSTSFGLNTFGKNNPETFVTVVFAQGTICMSSIWFTALEEK
jgi:hypothetical protein